jgi:hypothetical protein
MGTLVFGSAAVASMLVMYTLEDRSAWFVLAFAGACAASAAYGVLIEAWPFAAIEGIWSVIAVRRWWRRTRQETAPR